MGMSRVWIAGLLFCSGLCALVYQTAWMRLLRLIFGSSMASSAAVLAIFMGGLGLGARWLGGESGSLKASAALVRAS